MQKFIIKALDFTVALLGLILAAPILCVVTLLCIWDTGSPIFFQKRVGKNKIPFTLIKFRTMKTTTKSVASHLADESSITKVGLLLRKTKLDELPQLINVLAGNMSIVGPRPNLYSQLDVTAARDKFNLYDVTPGITGLAQINGVDMSTPNMLARADKKMMEEMSVINYFKFIILTATGKGKGDPICKAKHYTSTKLQDNIPSKM